MVDFCKRSINDGFPMRMNVSGGFLAYPGTFVRLDGCWKWNAICEEWESYTAGQHRRLDLAIAELKTRMAIPDLIIGSMRLTCAVSVVTYQTTFGNVSNSRILTAPPSRKRLDFERDSGAIHISKSRSRSRRGIGLDSRARVAVRLD